MAAKVHFAIGSTRAAILPTLLAEYRKAASEHLGGALWIAPSRRAVGAMRAVLSSAPFSAQPAARHSSAILKPNIHDFQSLAEELVHHHQPTLRPLTLAQRRLLLHEVIEEARAAGSLAYFERIADSRGFAEGALGFLDEVKSLGIDSTQFRKACTTEGASADACRRACANLYERYQAKLQRGRRLDLYELLSRATAILEEGRRRPFDEVQSIIVEGFSRFTPLQHALLQALAAGVKDVWVDRLDIVGAAGCNDLIERSGAAIGEGTSQRVVDLPRPDGLLTLERNLFRTPLQPLGQTEGILLVEAPGAMGEARLIARAIRKHLDSGVAAASILVTARDLTGSRDLLAEVFGEYEIPVDVEVAETLMRNPAVATLLRAVRLPDEDWPFAGVTALLRSNYFQPAWPECAEQPGIAGRAESLLRLLGEPRGREAYLEAVRIWSETPPEGLEDEQAEEPRRLRKIRLAGECRPFLQRFFSAWAKMPTSGNVSRFAAWLRQFSEDVGLTKAVADSAKDRDALRRLWDELSAWVNRQQGTKAGRSIQRSVFLSLLGTLTATPMQGRTSRADGAVRILGAEIARTLSADYLYVLGLGEGSFPDLSAPDSLLDDADRQTLQKQGLAFPSAGDRPAWERVLFYELASLPRKQLILSYPSVDEKGQSLLPSSYLRAVRDCFAPDSIAAVRQRMTIEGYLSKEPLSDAEKRVQFAAARRNREPSESNWSDPTLGDDLPANLRAAAAIARLRFRSDTFNEYDGWVSDSAILSELGARFGAEKIFSPTALEAYVACPFRFFLGNVLHLEPLEEPNEEIEYTRRGSAFHRALARFHEKLLAKTAEFLPTGAIPETVGEELLAQLDRAVKEYVDRAPSPASKVLWQLEGRRLRRSASRYTGHWQAFAQPWLAPQAVPLPMYLEADFGFRPGEVKPDTLDVLPPLTIRIGDAEVRIGGRIDRIDAARIGDEIGFWIIDYKTGKATSYTGKALQKFEKLQLSLYALAVERIFFAGHKARPLGLAYWLVTDTGAKPVLPEGRRVLSWMSDRGNWEQFRTQLEQWVITVVSRVRQGSFPLAPRSEKCTETCDFSQICRIGQSRATGKVFTMPLPSGDSGTDSDEEGE